MGWLKWIGATGVSSDRILPTKMKGKFISPTCPQDEGCGDLDAKLDVR